LSASASKLTSSGGSSSTSSSNAALLLSPRISHNTPPVSPRQEVAPQSAGNLQIKANLNEISLKLTDLVEEKTYKELIVVNGIGLGLSLVQNAADVKAVVKLNGLQVEDKFQPFGPNFQYLLLTNISSNNNSSSPTISEFVKIEYLSAHKDSPSYSGADQDIDVLFNTLHVNMNRETLIQLLETSKKFTSR
jgi:hypothetical protein